MNCPCRGFSDVVRLLIRNNADVNHSVSSCDTNLIMQVHILLHFESGLHTNLSSTQPTPVAQAFNNLPAVPAVRPHISRILFKPPVLAHLLDSAHDIVSIPSASTPSSSTPSSSTPSSSTPSSSTPSSSTVFAYSCNYSAAVHPTAAAACRTSAALPPTAAPFARAPACATTALTITPASPPCTLPFKRFLLHSN